MSDEPAAIESSQVEQSDACTYDAAKAEEADEEGFYLEDYRDNPTWVQHDVSDWPWLDDASGDGWFRTDEAHVDGIAHLIGGLVVQVDRGRIVDLAAPPGTVRFVWGTDISSQPQTLELAQIEPAHDVVAVRRVYWVTPDGIAPASTDPPAPRHLTGAAPVFSYPLAPDARVTAEPATSSGVIVDDGHVASISPTD